MKLKLEVSLDDDWAQTLDKQNWAWILRKMGQDCDFGSTAMDVVNRRATIYDPNGNTIGRVEVTE